METPKRYLVRTLGCKANLADSQELEASLQREGFVPLEGGLGGVDVCVVNSCTVTDEADDQSRKLATRLAREHPGAKIVYTGCGAEVTPLLGARSADLVIGNQDKHRLGALVHEALKSKSPKRVLGGVQDYGELLSQHPLDREWPLQSEVYLQSQVPSGSSDSRRTRAFLKIQEGCNHFCTYCIIPYGRGPSRSVPLENLVERARSLEEQGVREIVVTGTNIGDYGLDLKRFMGERFPFSILLQELLRSTRRIRVRLSSLDPLELQSGGPSVLDLLERERRLCGHVHVSLQSPVSPILKLMKRRYRSEHIDWMLGRLREASQERESRFDEVGGIFVGMDVITGFPGETAELFEETQKALSGLFWHRLHVFPYSERSGTPATRLKGSIDRAERVRRSRVLKEMSLVRLRSHYERVLSAARPLKGVLLENTIKKHAGLPHRVGYTSNYLSVWKSEPLLRANTIASAVPSEILCDPVQADMHFISV